MTGEEIEKVLQDAIIKFGNRHQVDICIEEMAELTEQIALLKTLKAIPCRKK